MVIESAGLLSTRHISKADLLFFFNQLSLLQKKSLRSMGLDAKQTHLKHPDGRPFKGVLAFFEASTRTKVSFESAGLDLGVQWINLNPASLSLKKGEALIDTFQTLAAYDPDFFVVRHAEAGVPHFVQHWTSRPVISAGDGMNEHPTQALLDAFTLWSVSSSKKFEIAFFGDVYRSRVARSSLDLFKKLGFKCYVVDDHQESTHLFAKAYDLKIVKRAALKQMDVVYALRVQRERGSALNLSPLCFADLGPKTLWMHPGPKIMGEDLSPELCDASHPRSLIQRQVRNGYLIRRHLLRLMLENVAENVRGSR